MPEVQPRRSPEVEAIIARALRSFAESDLAALERIINPGPEFRAIGSDPEEWWTAEGFLPVLAAQIAEMAGMEIDLHHLEAWEQGSVAWWAARVAITVAGSAAELRHTGVLVLDSGSWRIVQWHTSEGVTNEESLGFSLTTTLTEILDSLDLDADMATLPGEGMLTLMFTDVEGSTTHARELGDRRYAELMAEHIALVSRISERRGGQVIKTVGEGALLASHPPVPPSGARSRSSARQKLWQLPTRSA